MAVAPLVQDEPEDAARDDGDRSGLWRGMGAVLAMWAVGLDVAGIAFGSGALRVLCVAVGAVAGGVAVVRVTLDLWRERGTRE